MQKAGTILPFRGVWPQIAEDAFIAPGAVIIGNVKIGSGTSIWCGVIIRGDVHTVDIGERVNIQDGTVVHVSKGRHPTFIGDEVSIGHCALIHGCTLESRAFVGMRATVMDGAVVEGGGMVAAGALVTPNKRVRAGEMWAGSPATCWRQMKDEEVAHFGTVAGRYHGYSRDYLSDGIGLPPVPAEAAD
ncbi:MAG: gamma carbonic anhydrase family protein [Alphaproteobacteria bacterium]